MNPTAPAIVSAFLNSLWPAVAIAGIAWLWFRLTPRMNAATRHILWWVVLGIVVALPMLPRVSNRRTYTPQSTTVAKYVIPSTPFSSSGRVEFRQPILVRPSFSARAPVQLPGGKWPVAFLLVWAAVGFGQLARIAVSYAHVRRLKKHSVPAGLEQRSGFDMWMASCAVRRRPQLLISREAVSPMAVGFFQPAVVLPESLMGELQQPELDHVLLHELAHVARWDDWTNLLARVAGGALALHPVAWWILRRIDRERELACDDWAVAVTGSPKTYAASLTRLFELCIRRRRVILATGMATRSSQLGERIETILRRQMAVAPNVNVLRVALCGVTLVAMLAASSWMPRWVALAQQGAWNAGPRARVITPRPQMGYLLSANAQPRFIRTRVADQRSFLAALVAAGYGSLSVDEIIDVKNAGVTPDYLDSLAQSGWGPMQVRELIDLRRHGVNPEYLHQMHESGITGLTLRAVIDLRDRGVQPEAIREIHDLGFGPYDPQQVIDFWTRGVRPPLFHAFHDAGVQHLDPRDAIEAQNCGLNAHDLREAQQYGAKLTLQQVVRLKRAGVLQ